MQRTDDALHIFMLTDCYPPARGGIETHVHGLARQLARQGHRVEVVTHLRSPPDKEHPSEPTGDDGSDDVTVHRVPGLELHLWGLQPVIDVRLGSRLRQLLSGSRPDIVHSHALASVMGTVGLQQARRLQLPTVLTLHSVTLERRRPPVSTWALSMQRSVVQRWADGVIAVSAGCAQETAGIAVPVHVIPSGVDCARWKPEPDTREPVRQSLGYASRHVVVGFLGRLVPSKGVLDLPELAQGLIRIIPEVRFLVVGGGPLEQALKRRVQALGLGERFSLLGSRPWHETPAYLNAMDVFVFPSWAEAFGLALAEAMACGLPAVARCTAGAREVVLDGETGYLTSTEEELHRRVALLCQDESLRRRMGQAARASVERRFDWATVARRTADVYQAVIAARRQSSAGR